MAHNIGNIANGFVGALRTVQDNLDVDIPKLFTAEEELPDAQCALPGCELTSRAGALQEACGPQRHINAHNLRRCAKGCDYVWVTQHLCAAGEGLECRSFVCLCVPGCRRANCQTLCELSVLTKRLLCVARVLGYQMPMPSCSAGRRCHCRQTHLRRLPCIITTMAQLPSGSLAAKVPLVFAL